MAVMTARWNATPQLSEDELYHRVHSVKRRLGQERIPIKTFRDEKTNDVTAVEGIYLVPGLSTQAEAKTLLEAYGVKPDWMPDSISVG